MPVIRHLRDYTSQYTKNAAPTLNGNGNTNWATDAPNNLEKMLENNPTVTVDYTTIPAEIKDVTQNNDAIRPTALQLFASNPLCVGGANKTSFATEPTEITTRDAAHFFAHDHTTIKFTGGYSDGDNFEYATAIPLDIDNSHSDNTNEWIHLEDFEKLLQERGLNYWVAASRNHWRSKGEVTARPRFHVYLPLAAPLYDKEKFVRYCEWCIETFNGDPRVKSKAQKIFGYGDNPKQFVRSWTGGRCIDEVVRVADLAAITAPPAVSVQKQGVTANHPARPQHGEESVFDWFAESGEWRNHLGDLEARGWAFFEKDDVIYFQTPEGDHAPGMQDGNIKDGVAYFFSRAPQPFDDHRGYSICQLFAGAVFGDISSAGFAKFAQQCMSDTSAAPPQKKNVIIPRLIDVSKIEVKPIEWLWYNKLPYGGMSMFAGLPKEGKSMLTAYIAARVSRGEKWCDGTDCERGSVIFFAGEDSPEEYARRLEANGADLTKIRILDGASLLPEGSDKEIEIDITLARLDVIEAAIEMTEQETGLPVLLVIIDPISNFWGKVDENKNAEVRSVLHPLQQFFQKRKIVPILVQHLRKTGDSRSLQRIMGSIGIVGTARNIWGVYTDPKDTATKQSEKLRYFVPFPSNMCVDATAMSFQITAPDGKVDVVDWGIEKTGDDFEAAWKNPNLKRPPAEVTEEKIIATIQRRSGALTSRELQRILSMNEEGDATRLGGMLQEMVKSKTLTTRNERRANGHVVMLYCVSASGSPDTVPGGDGGHSANGGESNGGATFGLDEMMSEPSTDTSLYPTDTTDTISDITANIENEIVSVPFTDTIPKNTDKNDVSVSKGIMTDIGTDTISPAAQALPNGASQVSAVGGQSENRTTVDYYATIPDTKYPQKGCGFCQIYLGGNTCPLCPWAVIEGGNLIRLPSTVVDGIAYTAKGCFIVWNVPSHLTNMAHAYLHWIPESKGWAAIMTIAEAEAVGKRIESSLTQVSPIPNFTGGVKLAP